MKTPKFLTLFLLIVGSFHFTSCENEPVDPSISLNPENELACESPTAFSASNFIDGTKIVLDWESNAETWQVQYGPKGFVAGSGTGLTVTENSAMINGLLSTNQYDFYVRTVCDATTFSAWIGPVAAGTTIGSCAAPQNGTALRNATTPTTATVSWTAAAGTSNDFEVQYGNTGFSVGTGTMLTATMPTVTIPGLLTSVGYDFYVRTNCSATSSSTWAGPIRITASNPVNQGSFTLNISGVPFIANSIIAVKSAYRNPLTGEVMTDPDTGLPMVNYSITGKYNETKLVIIQWIQIDPATTSFDVPDDSAVVTYIPDALNPMMTYSSANPLSLETVGNISINSNNPTTRKISGTFRTKVYAIDLNTGQVRDFKDLTTGVFNNVTYVEQ